MKDDQGRFQTIGRGEDFAGVSNHDQGEAPMALEPEGQLSFYVRFRAIEKNKAQGNERIRIDAYRFKFVGLKEGSAGIASLRYDFDGSNARGPDWDEDLGDNPAHPIHHLHVNFGAPRMANDLRIAVGPVSPPLLLRNFNHWYRSQSET
ncbi:MAG: hypothetical protein N2C14_11210 [Planctomycetales bacterium]